ncbi:hypothetical protein [Neptunicoccus sediminis]|uniref:hypothetical protein n=1 Tax=Neptunicoccus sediminis TaxID=1892596 RepID=UPI000845F87D|nr:hypothetical protein [Neptunicoccus sediminis]
MNKPLPELKLTVPGLRIIAPQHIKDNLKKKWEYSAREFVTELTEEYCSAWASLILFSRYHDTHTKRALFEAELAEKGNQEALREAQQNRYPSAIENHFYKIQRDAFVFTVVRTINIIKLGPATDSDDLIDVDFSPFKEQLENAFPDARDVRNSIAHAEERRRKIKNGGKPMPPHISIVGAQTGDSLTTIGADGIPKSISFSAESLIKLKNILNELFAVFEWYGEPEKWPLDY